MDGTVNGEKPHPTSCIFDLDYSSTSVQLQLFGLGFGFYSLVFLLTYFLSALLSQTYRSLSAKEKVWGVKRVLPVELKVLEVELVPDPNRHPS